MKISKSLAGVAAGSLALAGVAVAAAPAAQAATYTTVWNGINNTALQANQNIGTKNVTVNVTGGATVGAPITVTVTSPDIAFDNGPAAVVQANWTRIDAVVAINGTDYLIKGPSNTGPAALNANIIAAGWTISSANGADAGTGAGGAVTNTDGVATLNSDGTIANASASLVAPGVAGTYTVTFKRLINNSVSAVLPATGGTGTDAVNDGFDQIWGLNTGVAPYNGATAANNFGTVATLNVAGPTIAVASVTNSVTTAVVPGAVNGGRAYFRSADVLAVNDGGVTGVWNGAYTAAGNIKVRVCADALATTGCSPYFVNVVASGSLSVNASGNLQAGSLGISAGSFSGNNYLIVGQHSVTAGYSDANRVAFAAFPVTILGTRTIVPTSTTVSPGSPVSVSGSNWYPGETVTIATNSAGDTGSSPTASNAGAFSNGSFAVVSGSTATQLTATGIGGAATPVTISISADSCTRQVGSQTPTTCTTQQNVTASVQAGALTQAASAYSAPGYTSTLIPLGSVTSSVTGPTLNGFLNPITVADARGGSSGWSLTAAMPAFTDGAGGSIANGQLAISGITCAATATGSATGNTAGSDSTFASTVTLCTKNTTADSAGGTSGGQYLVNANLALSVPAFQKAGAYTSTVTVTLT